MNHTKPQPMPHAGIEEVTSLVIADLQERSNVGAAKYGTILHTFNGRSAKLDLYQELSDALKYLKQELLEEEAETVTVCPACKAEVMRKARLIMLTPGGTYWTCFKCGQVSLAVSWDAAGVLRTMEQEEEIHNGQE